MSDELCSHCVAIPFDEQNGLQVASWMGNVGPASRLQSSSCPFCRLIRSLATVESWKTDIRDGDDLTLRWCPGGPHNRRAFRFPYENGGVVFGFPDRPERGVSSSLDHYLRSWNPSEINIDQIQGWLTRCDLRHSQQCRIRHNEDFTSTFPGLPVLRLIDTDLNCLIETRELPKYAALSYVWGSTPSIRLTRANRPHLLSHNSLAQLQRMLPKTTRDAMTLVRKLGVRYLWLDSLCLLQNDISDLEKGVNVMDSIYEHSWLTVIAADGHNANAGLAGVDGMTREPVRNTNEIKPGVFLGLVYDLEHFLSSSVYSTRAWTFQEQCLSRRALYFVNQTMYFRCRVEELAESCLDPSASPPEFIRNYRGGVMARAVHMKKPLRDFGDLVAEYSKRVLTNQADAVRAMTGIIRRFSMALGCDFFEGLPTAGFDVYLLFRGQRLARRRGFPSYSWSGWRGQITFPETGLWSSAGVGSSGIEHVRREKSWILWFKRLGSRHVEPVSSDPDATALLLQVQNRAEEESPTGTTTGNWMDELRRIARQLPPSMDMRVDGPLPDYPLLQFWTLSAFYKIGEIDVFRGTGEFFDQNDTRCGEVSFDGFEDSTFFNGKDASDPFEVLFLSDAMDINWRFPGDATVTTISCFNIMVVDTKGGIAERRGFGRLFQASLNQALAPGPSWKETILG